MSNYNKKDKTPLPIEKNKKVPGLFKDKLGSNDHEKSTKKCVIKQNLISQNFKDCLFNNKNVYRSQQRFKSYNHDVYTEEVNKIALNANVDKILKTFDRIITYPHGANAFKVCESEMLKDLFFGKLKWNVKMINFDN